MHFLETCNDLYRMLPCLIYREFPACLMLPAGTGVTVCMRLGPTELAGAPPHQMFWFPSHQLHVGILWIIESGIKSVLAIYKRLVKYSALFRELWRIDVSQPHTTLGICGIIPAKPPNSNLPKTRAQRRTSQLPSRIMTTT